ncbi:uncharacterized protein LOC124171227 [Ischnura elegans]|uniref:uncharacterized protein LOC124171227 n=1 Tax=Ischnura elegans TaxID=197161 RepID=UPI001ED8782F|nr:uncharacterized protein LOC124171227 [Ischnura elegans]
MNLKRPNMKAFAIVLAIVLVLWVLEERLIRREQAKRPYFNLKPSLTVNLKGPAVLDEAGAAKDKGNHTHSSSSTTANPIATTGKNTTSNDRSFLRAMEFIDKISSKGDGEGMSKEHFVQSSPSPRFRFTRELRGVDVATEGKVYSQLERENEITTDDGELKELETKVQGEMPVIIEFKRDLRGLDTYNEIGVGSQSGEVDKKILRLNKDKGQTIVEQMERTTEEGVSVVVNVSAAAATSSAPTTDPMHTRDAPVTTTERTKASL